MAEERRANHKYTMTISLSVLKHLGIGLYSNVPAVLSEVVANSWDADANEVRITIDSTGGEIVIEDDGSGMTTDDINNKYLTVGYDRRKNEPALTAIHKRRPMGKKGIGKLSVFSIADIVTVYSKKDSEVSGLLMARDEIEAAIEDEDGDGQYHPTSLNSDTIDIRKGTRIVLRDLKKNVSTSKTFLRRRLARRFSIIGPENNFRVFVNEKEITAKDREFFPKLEFLWYLGKESEGFVEKCANVKKSIKLSNIVDSSKGYEVTGWVGTAIDQKSIDEENNTIVLFARGKLVHEDILKEIKEGGLFTKYLIGEIDADFLDSDDEDDAITSGRQRVKEDDPRYDLLKNFVQKEILKRIQGEWTEFRKEGATGKALKNPAIAKWYNRLKGDHIKAAQSLFAKIESLGGIDQEGKKELYKHGIMAFEKLALRNTLSALDRIEREQDFELIKELFVSIDEIEAVHYHQIVRGRLEVIHQLERMVDSDPTSQERVLKEHIFDHLWLLHPSWERASTDQRIEQAVTKEFDAVTAKLSQEERDGRIDIRYRTAAGKHVIVELKKYDVAVNIHDLTKQIAKYRSALEKCLRTKFPGEPKVIETICVLGSSPHPKDDEARNIDALRVQGARFVTYDTLIAESLDSYSEYLQKEQEISEILEIIESI